MPEIGTSGSMSGDGKRSGAEWSKLPRPSSTLPSRQFTKTDQFGRNRRHSGHAANPAARRSDVNDPTETLGIPTCCDAQCGISYHAVVGCNPGVEAAHEAAR